MQGWSFPQPFETVEHTADTGVRVRGATREETLARLVLAHAALLTGGPPPSGDPEPHVVEAAGGAEAAVIAVDVLRELNRIFHARRRIAARVEAVEWSDKQARLRLWLGHYDAEAHAEGFDIKGVTFHAARFAAEGHGHVAEVIFDI